jgi:PAS domain S-box-containing protein
MGARRAPIAVLGRVHNGHLVARRPVRISDTSVMATGLTLGGDVEQALKSVGVPSYVLDRTGVVRWINPAAERLLGDIRGRQYTSVVAPEDSRRARELFTRKVLGTAPATDATGVLVSTGGTRLAVEISAVPLMNGERVVGVFGLIEERADHSPSAPPRISHPDRPRCFAFSNRDVRQSKSPRSFTSAPKRSETTSAICCEPSG